MSNIINLQRDQFHIVNLDPSADLAYPAGTAISTTVPQTSSGTVNQVRGFARATPGQAGPSAGNFAGIGVLMEYPTTDETPYRVKAYCGQSEAWVYVGYAPSSPTGSDNINSAVLLPMNYEFDDVLLLPVLGSAHPFFERAIAIGIAIGDQNTGNTEAIISVQKLSVAAPQYASAHS